MRHVVRFAPGGTIGSHAINATLYHKHSYDPVTSFAPIAP